MEQGLNRVVSLLTEEGQAEERMLGADLMQEIVARKGAANPPSRLARGVHVRADLPNH